VFGRETEHLAPGTEDAFDVFPRAPGEWPVRMHALDRRGEESLGAIKAGGETQRLFRGRGGAGERLRARGAPLEGRFNGTSRSGGAAHP
jgi:hypothetical protein